MELNTVHLLTTALRNLDGHYLTAQSHFNRWKALFFETVDANFVGAKAEEAKWRAERMAEMFQMKIEYHRNNNATSLL